MQMTKKEREVQAWLESERDRLAPELAAIVGKHRMNKELNDDLDDLFGGAPRTDVPKTPPVSYVEQVAPTYFEPCRRCSGTGMTRWGTCFACKGQKGKTYKSSAADREKARVYAAERKVKTAKERQDEFKAEHPEIAAWIDANQSFDFARSMGEAIAKWGSLTANQLAACERCVEREKTRKAEREAANKARLANAPAVDVSKIVVAFATAREKADRPGAKGIWMRALRLQSGEHALRFKEGSKGSQWEGMIFVKEGEKKLGHVKDGKFVRKFECTDAEQAAVVDVCNDPLKAAIAYGKAWSCCAVCGRELTNDESIERGIGPICAERLGW